MQHYLVSFLIEMRKDKNFGFFVPLEVNGIDGSVLDPRSTWADVI